MNPKQSSDVVGLLIRARQGDAEASAQLLEGCRNYLKLLARLQIDRVIQAKVDPSDLVQEVCMHAHQGFTQFRGNTEAELLGWLRQILAAKGANLARQFRGTKRRNVHLERRLLEAGERSSAMIARSLVAADSAPSQRAIRRERAVALADALSRLPDHYREVVILHSLEELPVGAASRLGARTDLGEMSFNQVRVHGFLQAPGRKLDSKQIRSPGARVRCRAAWCRRTPVA